MNRRWVRWAAPLALVLVVAAVTLPLTVHRTPEPPDGQTWIATLGTIRLLRAQDPDVVTQFFDREGSFALGGYNGAVPSTELGQRSAVRGGPRSGSHPRGHAGRDV